MCCQNPNNSAIVKKANCLAIITFIFGLITMIGIVFYPFIGGVGGIFTVVGTSIVMCCQGDKSAGHLVCAVLCILGAVCHATGAGWLWYLYVETLRAASATAIADAVASWASILIVPTAAIQTLAFVFDMVSVIYCFKARPDLRSRPPNFGVSGVLSSNPVGGVVIGEKV